MRDIAACEESYLYDCFCMDAEPIRDHAWGIEPTTIANIKAYKSKSRSLSSGQVLMRDYGYEEGKLIAKEMADQLCLDMAAQKLCTRSVSLYVGYFYTFGVSGSGGTAKLTMDTSASTLIVPAISAPYRRIVNPCLRHPEILSVLQ